MKIRRKEKGNLVFSVPEEMLCTGNCGDDDDNFRDESAVVHRPMAPPCGVGPEWWSVDPPIVLEEEGPASTLAVDGAASDDDPDVGASVEQPAVDLQGDGII